MKKKIEIVVILAAIGATGFFIVDRQHAKPASNPSPATNAANAPAANLPPLGSDRDEHGCIGSAGYSWCPLTEKCQRPWEESCSVTATFKCAGKKTVVAEFDRAPVDQVKLKLSDGRDLTLPHAISADGARYANADESIVFWNKGDTAFVTENGKETYSGCATGK